MSESTELLTLEFEGLPPTVNMMYRGIHGHRYKTTATQRFQADISQCMRKLWNGQPPYEGRVEYTITYFTINYRRWDIDNRVKALQDCLSLSGVIKDDSQVDKLTVERKYTQRQREYTLLTLIKYKDK